MDDIVTRLRWVPTSTAENCEQLTLITEEAADKIERLRTAGDNLVAAIRNHNMQHTHLKAWEGARRG